MMRWRKWVAAVSLAALFGCGSDGEPEAGEVSLLPLRAERGADAGITTARGGRCCCAEST